jgi:aspartyl protease family protein
MYGIKFFILSWLLAASCVWDAPQVRVVGRFPGAAVLNVDGQRKLVKVGQTGPGGVVVVSADSRGAVLRVDGVERSYGLSREYSEGFAAPVKKQLSIAKGIGGHYWVAGSVNG